MIFGANVMFCVSMFRHYKYYKYYKYYKFIVSCDVNVGGTFYHVADCGESIDNLVVAENRSMVYDYWTIIVEYFVCEYVLLRTSPDCAADYCKAWRGWAFPPKKKKIPKPNPSPKIFGESTQASLVADEVFFN